MGTVDLDDVATWPADFRATVEHAAVDAEEDTWFFGAAEAAAVEALNGFRLRAYHCTRLTAREVARVRAEGLRPLSPEFTRQRLADAVSDGHLSQDEAEFYGQKALPQAENRTGRVWLFTNRKTLASAPAIGYLVEVWGGEGITMNVRSRSPEMERLERVGAPTVVIAALDLAQHCHRSHPGVLTAAVRQLRFGEGGTTIENRATIGPDHIESIENPGGAFWNDFVWTPRYGFTVDP